MTPELPNDKFDIIYADPPWKYNFNTYSTRDKKETGGAATHYNTMTLAELKKIKYI